MTKEEVQKRVQLSDGTNISLDNFMWDEKTNTFSSQLNELVFNFSCINNCTFDTGWNCTFKTGGNCTFKTGENCTFDTGWTCTFKTGGNCTFDTGWNCTFKTGGTCTFKTGENCTFDTGWTCTFKTGENCTFKTGGNCTFKTGENCTFDTGGNCTFDTGGNCTFKTGGNCTFKTGGTCTFKTGGNCVIVRRDVFEVIQSKEGESIKICPNNIAGYLSKIEGDKYYIKDEIPHDIFDGILCRIISQKGSIYKIIVHGESEESYVVQQGELFAHGKTIKECKESLIYKISSRDTSEYNGLTLDSVVSYEQAVKMYRCITGACESQTKTFAEKHRKIEYTVKDLIEITEGQYNSNLFKEFFVNAEREVGV